MKLVLRLVALVATASLAVSHAGAQKIGGIPAAATVNATDKIPASQNGTTASITPVQLASYMTATGLFQASDVDLTAIAALATQGFGRSLLTMSDAPSTRALLGLGTLATQSGTFSGSSSGTNTGDQTSVSGNAGTATKLATARTINGVPFDGTTAITINAVDATPRAAVAGQAFTGQISAPSVAGGTGSYPPVLRGDGNNINYGVGYNAMNPAATGANNLGFGYGALGAVTGGGSNVAFGNYDGSQITTGSGNVLFGFAINGITTGGNNVLIGSQSGANLTTESGNVVIGGWAGAAGMAANVALSDGLGTLRYRWDGAGHNFYGGPVVAPSVRLTSTSTVANLPTCNAAARGTRTVVTDAASPTFLASLSGGGSVTSPAFCNGSTWVAG